MHYVDGRKSRQRSHSAIAIVTLCSLSVLNGGVHHWLSEYPETNVYGSGFAWVYLGLLAVPLLVAAQLRSTPLREYGICSPSQRAWRESLTLIAAGLLVLSLLGDLRFPESWAYPPLGSWGPLRFLPVVVSYLLHACLQEFLRAVLFRILQEELGDARGGYSVVLCAILFASSHLHFGWSGAATVGGLSAVLGLLFLWQKNIFSVALIHGVLGLAVFAIGWI